MNWFSLLLIFIALLTFVIAQLLLKHAMESTVTRGFGQRTFGKNIALGTFLMAISFFLTLGLLQKFDLSYLYPFEGLTVIFIIVAAAILLREKLTAKLIIGSLLISAGVVLVAIS
ncbi:MAG: EamA family transporter [Chthoniobacterales bacterium]